MNQLSHGKAAARGAAYIPRPMPNRFFTIGHSTRLGPDGTLTYPAPLAAPGAGI